MKEENTINACAFFIKDEEGNAREGGILVFKKLHSSIQIECKTFKEEARQRMVRTCPPGGTAIVDRMTGGRIELLASEMDDSIPISAIISAVDFLREKFDVPISQECLAEASRLKDQPVIAVKPNPARS